jgi:hypothetical protein
MDEKDVISILLGQISDLGEDLKQQKEGGGRR